MRVIYNIFIIKKNGGLDLVGQRDTWNEADLFRSSFLNLGYEGKVEKQVIG